MSRACVDRQRACLYVLGVCQQSERQESVGRTAADSVDAKRLQDGARLLAQDAVTSRTRQARLPAQIIRADHSGSGHDSTAMMLG